MSAEGNIMKTVAFRDTPGTWICAQLGHSNWADLLEVMEEVHVNKRSILRLGGVFFEIRFNSSYLVVSTGDWVCARFDDVDVMVLTDEGYQASVLHG